MNANEFYYRRVIGSIGLSLLLFLLLFQIFGVAVSFLPLLLDLFMADPIAIEVVLQVFYAVGYMLTFMFPALAVKRLIQRNGLPYRPVRASLRLSPWVFAILPAGITLILASATVNASLVNVIGYSEFFNGLVGGDSAPYAPYQIVLQVLTTALVPGFCEELLFRGAIQTNLVPFGRSNAIFISAFLFALMHQNAGQIFYAFAAGILLGVIYEMTESIWACTALHVMNNLYATVEGVLLVNADPLTVVILECAVFAVGVVAMAILIVRFFSKRADFKSGIFEKDLPASDEYALYPLAQGRARKLFFTPTMIIFLILCALQILLLLFLAAVVNVV